MRDLKLLKLKCQEREQRAKEKKRILKMQLEEAIRGKEATEKEYGELMSKFNSPSRHIARGRLDAADNSFLNLVSTPAPGSDSEKEESSGGLGLTSERGSQEANLSGTPPRTRGTSQNTPGGDSPLVAEDDSTNAPSLSTQETLEVDMPGGNPETQSGRVMADILATRRVHLDGMKRPNDTWEIGVTRSPTWTCNQWLRRN